MKADPHGREHVWEAMERTNHSKAPVDGMSSRPRFIAPTPLTFFWAVVVMATSGRSDRNVEEERPTTPARPRPAVPATYRLVFLLGW